MADFAVGNYTQFHVFDRLATNTANTATIREDNLGSTGRIIPINTSTRGHNLSNIENLLFYIPISEPQNTVSVYSNNQNQKQTFEANTKTNALPEYLNSVWAVGAMVQINAGSTSTRPVDEEKFDGGLNIGSLPDQYGIMNTIAPDVTFRNTAYNIYNVISPGVTGNKFSNKTWGSSTLDYDGFEIMTTQENNPINYLGDYDLRNSASGSSSSEPTEFWIG